MNNVLNIKSIDFSDLENDRYPIWGEFWMTVNGVCFPSDAWYDALSSILDMWLLELIELLNHRKQHCCLYFMDGPYFLSLSVLRDYQVLVSCRNNDGIEYMHVLMPFSDFIQNFLDCVNLFVEECHKNAPFFETTRTGARIIGSYKALNVLISDIVK